MLKKIGVFLMMALLISGCSRNGIHLDGVFASKSETVTFDQSLYRPQEIFEKVSCDAEEGCFKIDNELEAGLLIANLMDQGVRRAAILADEDLDLDKIFMYAYVISPSTFEARYTQRRMMSGQRRTVFDLIIEDENQLLRNRQKAQALCGELLDASMSTEEKLRTLHDWVILNTRYDEAAPLLDSEGRQSNLSFKAAGLFDRGTATCSGYMEAMDLLCKSAGIGSLKVFSNTMDHAWNMVDLDGELAYVDATFDDPVPDQPGRVLYDYFLMDASALHRAEQYEFDPSTSSTLSEEEYVAYFHYLFSE